jgi:hypothetical protein
VAADLDGARVRLADADAAPDPVLVDRGPDAGQRLVERAAPRRQCS